MSKAAGELALYTNNTSVEWRDPSPWDVASGKRIQNDINQLYDYYQSVPQRFVAGSNSIYVKGYEGATRVKRRIYLFMDENKVRAIALGFRTEDREAIETWAENDLAALALEIDPSEVDVKFIAPPTYS